MTRREIEVVRCAAEEKTAKETAFCLLMSERTVTNHLSSVYRKFGVRNKAGIFFALMILHGGVRLGRDDIIALCPAGVFDSIANGLSRSLQARKLLTMRSEETRVKNGELFVAEDAPFYGATKTAIAPPVQQMKKTANEIRGRKFTPSLFYVPEVLVFTDIH